MFLSDKEVQRLTGKVRPSAQARQLARDGIEYVWIGGRPRVPVEQFQPKETRGRLVLDATLA